VKLLLNILRPRFVVPVIGEYRHLVALQNIALGMGYDKKNILMLDNGQVAELNNKSVVNLSQRLPQGDLLVDGTIDSDLSDIVLRDREMLAQDGVLLIIANIDAKQKKVLNEPEIVSRGFVYMKENEELIRELSEQFQQVAAKEMQGKYINWRTFKQNVKKQISNYVYKQTRRSPIIIPVLIDTSK
jgi:ribonuclease J